MGEMLKYLIRKVLYVTGDIRNNLYFTLTYKSSLTL